MLKKNENNFQKFILVVFSIIIILYANASYSNPKDSYIISTGFSYTHEISNVEVGKSIKNEFSGGARLDYSFDGWNWLNTSIYFGSSFFVNLQYNFHTTPIHKPKSFMRVDSVYSCLLGVFYYTLQYLLSQARMHWYMGLTTLYSLKLYKAENDIYAFGFSTGFYSSGFKKIVFYFGLDFYPVSNIYIHEFNKNNDRFRPILQSYLGFGYKL